jgi:hypothetical protein
MAYDDLYNLQSYAGPYDDEEPSWVKSLANSSIFAPIKFIGDSLGKPGQALYGVLDSLQTGKIGDFGAALANLIPFSDTFGITSDEEGKGLIHTKDLSGQQMLKNWGVIDGSDSWGNWGAGLALDLLSDPMNFATFGAGALTKAGMAAKKAGTLERTMAGRISKGQGGWAGLRSQPWYMDLISSTKGEPVAAIGTGSWGLGAANKMADLGDAALRWKVPGTEFSPVGKLASMFTPHAGFTGTPEFVAQAGGKLEDDLARFSSTATGFAMNDVRSQGDALNKLAALGMKEEDAARELWRAGTSFREVGEVLPSAGVTAAQQRVIDDFANRLNPNFLDAAKSAADAYGVNVKDVNLPWRNYEPRRAAGYQSKLRGQQMERTDLDKFLPYGTVQLDDYARDAAFSGFANRKAPGVPYDPTAVAAQTASNAAQIAQDISGGIQNRFGNLLHAGAPVGPVSPEMLELLKYADVNEALKPAGEIADYLAKLPPEAAGRGMFAKDLATGRVNYGQNLAKQSATANAALRTLAAEAGDKTGMLTAASNAADVVPLTKALEDVGLGSGARAELQRLAGRPLDDLAVTPDLVKSLKKEVTGPVGKPESGLSKLTSMFRYGVTVPWPANLTRNWGDTLLQQGLAGQGVGKNLGAAESYFRRALTDPAQLTKAQTAFEEGFKHGLFDDQLRGLLGVEGLTKGGERALNVMPTQTPKTRLESLGEHFSPVKQALGTPGVKGKVTEPVKEYLKAMEGSHAFQNNVTRLQQMMNLIDEGWAPAAAAKKVKVTQLDYNRLSNFERDFARTAIPFYNFSRQNIRRTGQLLQDDPGRLGALFHLANSGRTDGDYVPPYVSAGAAVPIPGAQEGFQRFVSSFGLPIEDEAIGALAAFAGGEFREGFRRAASASNPTVKTAYEIGTGTQVFSGRPLEDLKPSGVLASLLGDNSVSRFLSQAVQATPASRVLSTADRIADAPNKGVLASLLNLGTGVRVTDTDVNLASEIAAREELRDLLKASGKFKKRESVYLDQRQVKNPEELPEELYALLQQYRAIEKRSQEAARQRQGAN